MVALTRLTGTVVVEEVVVVGITTAVVPATVLVWREIPTDDILAATALLLVLGAAGWHKAGVGTLEGTPLGTEVQGTGLLQVVDQRCHRGGAD